MTAPIRYMPHRNCIDVADWLGWGGVLVCDRDGDSDLPLCLDDGRVVEPGQWLSRDGDTIHITDHEPIGVPDGT